MVGVLHPLYPHVGPQLLQVLSSQFYVFSVCFLGHLACWACKWGAPKNLGGGCWEMAQLTGTILAWRRGTALAVVHVSPLWGTPRRLG